MTLKSRREGKVLWGRGFSLISRCEEQGTKEEDGGKDLVRGCADRASCQIIKWGRCIEWYNHISKVEFGSGGGMSERNGRLRKQFLILVR